MKILSTSFLCSLFFMAFSASVFANPDPVKPFVVVLDAGHGGKDPGNLGNGYMEKIIALKIALEAGALLSSYQDIKVIYTRDSDDFVALTQRGAIANKAKADIFISIHCDSHTSNAFGAGTFVLGLHANKQNFAVAKKENSAIYLEENFEERYAQYDINSPESVIGFTIMQEEFLDKSIQLAKSMQDRFAKGLKRNDRKVKQAGFIVLHQTFMPSVLVETGFLTNANEGAYLNSKKGQSEMAAAIAEAVLEYKNGLQTVSLEALTTAVKESPVVTKMAEVKEIPVAADAVEAKNIEKKKEDPAENQTNEASSVVATPVVKTLSPSAPMVENKKETVKINPGIVFKIQLMAVSKKTPLTADNFKGLSDISTEPVGSLHRYFYGKTPDYKQAKDLLIQAVNAGYLNAFVAAYENGTKISLTKALESLD
ncbi:N-acetylmuramoyl-L-alanine amidase [Flavobacteriaceae bacterium]|nr:N-acetylmuramoyl-L-alanine amidase [Flavobacteriaceae bacterium]